MDRPLNSQEHRKALTRRLLIASGALAAITILVVVLTGWVRPSVRRSDLRVAVVDHGAVEATITATGVVVPEYESVIVSPVDTRVSRILRKPGDAVQPGDEIVSLDQGEPEAELRKLDDGIELRKNARELARLELENTLTDLRGRLKVKALERKSLEFEVARNAKLLEMGAISKDAARSAETRIETIDVEMAQIGESMENAKRDLEIQLRGLDLEISILRRDRDESARRLERATATADRAGVITWVVPVEGVSVARGAEIARIADLGSYRVEATLSDVHSGRISRGLPVRVRVGETLLDGRLTSIRPTVENGIITVEVALDDPSFRELRPQLRADVYIVTERKETVVRLKRGSLVSVDGASAVFRLAGNRAIRTPVEIGIASFDSCEVVSGLSEGDQVIISDMSNYQDLREVLVR